MTRRPAVLVLAAALFPAAVYAQTLAVASMAPASSAQTQAMAQPTRLSLADAVARGLEYNVAVIVQEQQRRVASSQRLEALSALLPHASASVRQATQVINTAAFGFSGFGGLPNLIGPFSTFDARVGVSAPILDASAHAKLAASRAEETAANADYRTVRETVALAVGNLYLQVLADTARVRSTESQVTTAEALVRLATDRNAAGVVARIDVVRQQVQLEAARAQAIAAGNQLAKRKLQLAHAIGLAASDTIELTDAATYRPAPELTLEAAIADAAAHRNDLKSAQARVESAGASREAAAHAAWPSLHIDADVGVLGLSAGSAERTYSVAAAVRVPLFEGGRTRARVEQAAAELRAREAELTNLDAGVRFEVRAAFLDVDAAAASVQVAQSGEALAGEELTQAEDRFRAGVASSIELVQAQDAVARASEQYIASVYAHNVAKAELARALGGVESRYLSFVTGRQ